MRNFFLVDLVRDRLNLGERWTAVRNKIQEWGIKNPIGYESYGMQSDLDYFQERQEAEGFYFHIEPLGGAVGKDERIKRLVPLFSRGRFFLPYSMPYTDIKEKFHELIMEFMNEEYEKFPFSAHDDILDCMSRIMDTKMNVTFPSKTVVTAYNNKGRFDPLADNDEKIVSWMSV
jgi:phage terminase large subunit-like protein